MHYLRSCYFCWLFMSFYFFLLFFYAHNNQTPTIVLKPVTIHGCLLCLAWPLACTHNVIFHFLWTLLLSSDTVPLIKGVPGHPSPSLSFAGCPLTAHTCFFLFSLELWIGISQWIKRKQISSVCISKEQTTNPTLNPKDQHFGLWLNIFSLSGTLHLLLISKC